MIKSYLGTSVIFICLSLACSTIQPQTASKESDGVEVTQKLLDEIVDIEWQLIRMTVNGEHKPLVKNSRVTFVYGNKGQVAGAASINRYFGNLKLTKNGAIVWNKAFGMTRMAGPPELMTQESVFMDTLMKTSRMYLNESTLKFKSEDLSTVLEFEK